MQDQCIKFRLTEDENQRLLSKAKEQNLSCSEYLRRKIEKGIEDDEDFNAALEILVAKIKVQGEKINRAAADANTNGLKDEHVEITTKALEEQMRLLYEFQCMIEVSDETTSV